MVDYIRLFQESKSMSVQYKGKTLIPGHLFPVSHGDILIVSIESTNHHLKQGINLDISGTCEVNGELIDLKKGKKQGACMFFWEDTFPQAKIKVFPKKKYVFVVGARKWPLPSEEETKKLGYTVQPELGYDYAWCAAMWLEEIPDGWRYHCCNNTYCSETQEGSENFDELVFTVRKLPKTNQKA